MLAYSSTLPSTPGSTAAVSLTDACLPACYPTPPYSPAAGLAQQADLELMLLSDNKLSGELPVEWQTPRLVRLDVQGNELTGE